MSEKATLTKEEAVNQKIEHPAEQPALSVSEPDDTASAEAAPLFKAMPLTEAAPQPVVESTVEPDTMPAAEPSRGTAERKTPSENFVTDDANDYFEDEKPAKRMFHFNKENKDFARDEWILSHIGEEHLMDYLKLEQRRSEQLQEVKDVREKRILGAFQLAVSLAAVVAVIYLLRDNPTILVNILYIIAILTVLWMWKNPKDKK